MNAPSTHAYPLIVNLAGRLVVIIGGGKVAARKARGLLEGGATRVRVVAPEFDPDMPEGVERLAAGYEVEHIRGAFLVFAATNLPVINHAVKEDCRKRGILCTVADGEDTPDNDFVTPAVLRRGHLLVTVSAAGAPAVAAAVRDEVAQRLDTRWPALVGAMRKIRPLVRARKDLSQAQRAEILRLLASPRALALAPLHDPEWLLEWAEGELGKTPPEAPAAGPGAVG
jgi:precorrin-2 dehydrogenase/sirohydrochlorin ferrochelatase